MELHGPAPGVQDAEEARQVDADVPFVGGQLPECGAGGLEQRVEGDLGLEDHEGPEFLGDREGDHEVVGGQLLAEASVQPFPGLGGLARGAHAVSAGLGEDVLPAAAFADEEQRSVRRGAAALDGADDLQMLGRELVPMLVDVLVAVVDEELLDVPVHRITRIISPMILSASTWAGRDRWTYLRVVSIFSCPSRCCRAVSGTPASSRWVA